ncbi:hypothetical protein ACFL3T_03560 [Patescibacteria group bacterium]
MKLTLNKILIGLGGIAVIVIYAIHLSLITSGQPSFMSAELRDGFITAIGLIFTGFYVYQFLKKNNGYFLIIANLMLLVGLLHLFKLIFGGYPC